MRNQLCSKDIVMINLKLLNKGLRGVLTPSEFMTLYVIENNLGKGHDVYKKIYNEQIADLVGLSERQIKRLVKSLVKKGFIKKKTIQKSKDKRECLYSLNLDILNDKTEGNDDTNVPSQRTIKNNKELYNNDKASWIEDALVEMDSK